jgi:hypothetical protein
MDGWMDGWMDARIYVLNVVCIMNVCVWRYVSVYVAIGRVFMYI